MKRFLLFLLMLICISSLAFSAYQEKGRFNFSAYYMKTYSEQYVTLDVMDSRMNSGIIMLTYQGAMDAERVFNWSVSGNVKGRVDITFSFTPLQAYNYKEVDGVGVGTYYIPEHKFQIKSSGATIITPATIDGYTLVDSFMVKDKHNVSFSKAEATHQYPGCESKASVQFYYPILIYGTIQKKKNNTTINLGDTDEVIWTRNGYCELTITDYDRTVNGELTYMSNVKIEVSLQ